MFAKRLQREYIGQTFPLKWNARKTRFPIVVKASRLLLLLLLLLLPVCDVQDHRSGVRRDDALTSPYGSHVVDKIQGERNEMGMLGGPSSMLNGCPQLGPKNAGERVAELVVRI